MNVPLLHVVATDDVAEADGFRRTVGELMEAGKDRIAVHLRLRRADGRHFHRMAERLTEAAGHTGAWLVVNGRVDAAITAGVKVVQLGSGALPVHAARRIPGPRLIIGASVHSAGEALARAEEGADFLVAGTVFRTETHPDRAPAGPALVTQCAATGLPVVGIGGIDANNAGRVVAAGAAGVAAVRAIWAAADPVAAAVSLIELVSRGGDPAVAREPGDLEPA